MQGFRELITQRDHAEARGLLLAAGLDMPEGVTFGLGWYEDGALGGAGFLAGNILCGICIHPSRQGEGLASGLVCRLIRHAVAQGMHTLLLFTSPAEAPKFQDCGLQLVAQSPHAALLEFGRPDCAAWLEHTRGVIQEQRQAMLPVASEYLQDPQTDKARHTGAVVMNANPFTRGHLHLARTALQHCAYVYVFVVEEDASVFPFDVRLELVRQGLGQEPRAIVLPSGPYMVSRASFPAYFTGKAAHSRVHAELDSTVFAARIAGALDIGVRFVGREPSCAVTARYNVALKEILPQYGVACVEIERLSRNAEAISASRVRALLAGPDADSARDELQTLVPATTLDFLQSEAMQGICKALREQAGNSAM